MYRVSWHRHEDKALADSALTGEALTAALEDYIRRQNRHLTDVRLQRATAADGHGAGPGTSERWYDVTYVADDGEGY